ncbi:MAG TPA: cache domain-containing protein [Rhodopseudomonas sp.]|uniref:cache domain-containing protein n=1 Tax=Rhodopseudomonas sp. TaxID=1078 RepID=UPI002ED861A4
MSLLRTGRSRFRQFRTKSIRFQLFNLIALSAVSLACLSVFAAFSLRNEMLESSIRETIDLAEVARSTAQTYHDMAVRGEIDDASARRMAERVIRNMRYANEEYFFVYDTSGIELVHGTMPDREGKNYLGTTDSRGYAYLPDMLKLAKDGGGHVFYWFPKPGSRTPVRKVTSAIGFAPWGWTISTGVYLEDVDSQFWSALTNFALISIIAIVLVSIIAVFISESIARPVRSLAAVTARIGMGQYDIVVPATERADEIGILAGAIRVLRDEAKAAEGLRFEQERLNRVLRTVGAGNAVLLHSSEEQELASRMCQAIVDAGGYRLAWIGLAENNEIKSVRPMAIAGYDDGYLSSAQITWGNKGGEGPTGVAIRTGIPQINDDTLSDDKMTPWRTSAMERDLRSGISLPMHGPGGVLGCITIYADEPHAFSAPGTVSLLVDLANNLAFGIVGTRERRRREEMESQLNQAQKMEALGQLAGSVAHDFNNLLGAILGLAGFIVEDAGEDYSTKHHAARIIAAGERGKTLIRQILSFARRGDLKRECFSITELVDETRALLLATIPTTTQMVLVADSAEPVGVIGDRDQLQQVLINLCINAHDALGGQPGQVKIVVGCVEDESAILERLAHRTSDVLPPAGEVWTDDEGTVFATVGSFDHSRRYVSLTVEDSGCGMPAEVVAQIFKPFFTTKKKSYGTGLGLSMVHGAVLAHGGALSVSSRPGKGSIFEILLPIAHEFKGKPPAPAPVPVPVSVQAGGRVLLVDDDHDFGDMLMIALERRGFEVSPCSDPREALEGLREHPDSWDAVITDQVMPHMTGLDLIRELRREVSNLPCILCTAYAEDQLDDERLKDAGIYALLRKPVDIDELTHHLMRAIMESRQSVENKALT